MTALRRESAQRVRPGCPHFGLHAGACGGCKMQHLHAAAQVAVKQRVLEDNLWHLAKVQARTSAAPDRGPGLGLPRPGPPVGALRGQEGRRC
jgi:23S rRNA (uracil1939-C5)-methyltransferase